MISLLAKKFIKDYDNVNDPDVRRHYGILSGIAGIVFNILLFILKFFAGVISNSIAIKADAFNNLSDAGSSIISLVGFKFAGSAPDPNHPFGHGRIEYISGFCVSILIILMGFELSKSSIEKIISPSDIDTSLLSIAILLCSILVKIYMYFYNNRIGKKISSPSMRATATDSLSDSVATSVVLTSTLFTHFTGINIDGWCGVAVALFILYAGYSAAKDTLSPILGQPPSEELVKDIEQTVLAHPEIVGIHDLIVHDYGPGRLMISLHGEVPSDGDINKLHDTIDCIESELNSKFHCVSVIHMDPIATNDSTVMEMRAYVTDLASSIDERITVHDFRMVVGPTHTNLIFDAVLPYRFSLSDDEFKSKISSMIQETHPKCFCVIHIDRFYI